MGGNKKDNDGNDDNSQADKIVDKNEAATETAEDTGRSETIESSEKVLAAGTSLVGDDKSASAEGLADPWAEADDLLSTVKEINKDVVDFCSRMFPNTDFSNGRPSEDLPNDTKIGDIYQECVDELRRVREKYSLGSSRENPPSGDF